MEAFIIMPFSEEFDDIYNLGIKQVCEEQGVEASRLDEQLFHEGMLERIYQEIENCDFIIADLSDKNPNVFYELGYAHALGKLCLLITKNTSDIPFDPKHKRHIVYRKSIVNLKNMLIPNIKWAKKEVANNKEKILKVHLSYEGNLKIENRGFLGKRAMGILDVEIDIVNTTKRTIKIHTIYIYSVRKWVLQQNGVDVPSTLADNHTEHVYKYSVKPSTENLSKEGWAQVRFKATQTLADEMEDQSIKDEYNIEGDMIMRIDTHQDSLQYVLRINERLNNLPF